MSWLLKVAIYIAAALVFAIVNTITTKALGVEISGSTVNKIGVLVIRMVLSWGLLLIYLELRGAKITWPS